MLRAAARTALPRVARSHAPIAFQAVRSFASAHEQDVVIIGGGPGGYVAAIKAAQLGLKTTCVEMRGALGGTCLNVGCIPSKALLHTTHMYTQADKDFAKHGIQVDGLKMDVAAMLKYKDGVVKGLTQGIEGLFKKNKVAYEAGKGEIISPNEVKVTMNDGSAKVIKTKNIVIATGSDVMPLPGVEIDEDRIVSSTGALDLKEVPKKMVVIGGGIIGLEMGSVWSRLGSDVTVVEFMDGIGAGLDKEVSQTCLKLFKKQKINFKLSTKVTSAVADKSGVDLTLEPAKGGDAEKLRADVVLVAIGRRPYTDGLGLGNVGLGTNERGFVDINDHWQTAVPNIYAIGDTVRGPMLAHKAEEEGVAVAESLAGMPGHVNLDAIPGVMYTHPEVAWVGKTEEQLKAEGIKYKVGKFNFMANSRARANGDTDGLAKVVTDAETDKILGVHIVNSNAGELIAEAVLAVEYGAASEDVARTCHAHPTLSEAVKEAMMAAHGKPIHS